MVTLDVPQAEQLGEVRDCLAKLEEQADLTQYTTDAFIHDLDAVRQALGYDQINLLGVSYGTRAALEYLRLYPDYARTLILDGVVPAGWGLGTSMRADAQRALDLIFERCKQDPDCKAAFPNLKGAFYDLLSSLQEQPREVSLPNPVTGETIQARVSPLMLSVTVRIMSYNDSQAALLPLMIQKAVEGDYSLLVSQYMLLVGSVGSSINTGLYYSVWCNEDLPLLPEEGELGMFYFDGEAMDSSRAICDFWPRLDEPVVMPIPPRADVPMLIISGEDDPVTPPVNGENVAAHFPNSKHLVIPGMGHNNVYVGCVPTLVRDFLEAGSAAGLDESCVEQIQPLPFFVSPVGPAP